MPGEDQRGVSGVEILPELPSTQDERRDFLNTPLLNSA